MMCFYTVNLGNSRDNGMATASQSYSYTWFMLLPPSKDYCFHLC